MSNLLQIRRSLFLLNTLIKPKIGEEKQKLGIIEEESIRTLAMLFMRKTII